MYIFLHSSAVNKGNETIPFQRGCNVKEKGKKVLFWCIKFIQTNRQLQQSKAEVIFNGSNRDDDIRDNRTQQTGTRDSEMAKQ